MKMKKKLVFLLSAMMILLLTACGSKSGSYDSEDDSPTAKKGAPKQNRVLIVYYSYSGTTKSVAQSLQKKNSGDLYEIKPDKAYPSDIYETSDRAKQERDSGKLPKLTGKLPDVSNYDLILVGGPVWSGAVATPVMSFLDQMDFKGKAVAGFWTDSGDPGEYAANFDDQVNHATVHKGLGLSNVSSYKAEKLSQTLDSWLKGLTATKGSAKGESTAKEENNKITITVGDRKINAELNNSKAAQEFKHSLPTTVSMKRMGGHEYYGSLEKPLKKTEDIQTGYTVGDLAFWTPGNLFAVYFNKPDEQPTGLMILGKITSKLSVFDTMNDSVEMKIELD